MKNFNSTKQDYFIHNGIRYPCGTQVKLKRAYPGGHELAYFVYYDTEHNFVSYVMCATGNRSGCSMKAFLQRFDGVTGMHNPYLHPPRTIQLKDSQIPKLVVGWIWYIAIMLFLAITTIVIPGWIITSIIFFRWRDKVIKEEGYYIKW